ncbi:unnamed protein product [Coccothraustes coccothraustes]
MGNVRSCTGASATETRTGRAGGGDATPARSCPVPAYMTCRRIAEARGFRPPPAKAAPTAPSKLVLKVAPPSPPRPSAEAAAAEPRAGLTLPLRRPRGRAGARVRQRTGGGSAPRALSLGAPLPPAALLGQCPGADTSDRTGSPGPSVPRARCRLPPPERRPRQSVPLLPAPGSRSSRATRSPARWSIRAHFQSHGS